MKRLIVLLVLLAESTLANADNTWGCQVLLCMANPNGSEAVAECVPPIEHLWSALANGDAFPTCSFQDSQGNDAGPSSDTYANNQWASASFCLPPYLVHVMDTAYCTLSGAITVTVNGAPFSRVWWGPGVSVTEFNTANPALAAAYQAQLAAYQTQQSLLAKQQTAEF